MAIKTTSLVPFQITSIPERLTPVYVTDKRVNTATTGGTIQSAAVRVNRLNSASFNFQTPVTEVTEMGAQFRVGGVDDLGEVSFKMDMYAVGINNMAGILGKKVDNVSTHVTTIGLTEFQAALIDVFRFVADSQNNIFGTLYMQDCIFEEFNVDAREKGLVMEGLSGKGPNATFFPGYIVPKVYIASSTDVSNGYLDLSTFFGADEQPVQIYLPTSTLAAPTIPSTASVAGGALAATSNFIKVTYVTEEGETLPSPEATQVNLINTLVQVTSPAAVGTAYAYNVYAANTAGGGSGAEKLQTATPIPLGINWLEPTTGLLTATAVPPSTSTATPQPPSYWQQNGSKYFLKIEKVPGAVLTANPTRFFEANNVFTPAANVTATWNSGSSHLALPSGSFSNGDMFRLVFCTYNTDTFPTTVPTTSPDTAERPGITTRIIPISINSNIVHRVQSCSIRFSFKREHVQGVGENTIIYGVPSVPDVSITLDAKEYDDTVLSMLSTGLGTFSGVEGSIANDFQDLNYITRINLSEPNPLTITLFDPFSVGSVLATYSSPHVVVKGVNFGSTAKSDNSLRFDAMDIVGNFTISYTAP